MISMESFGSVKRVVPSDDSPSGLAYQTSQSGQMSFTIHQQP
jgi:hypothetical protein